MGILPGFFTQDARHLWCHGHGLVCIQKQGPPATGQHILDGPGVLMTGCITDHSLRQAQAQRELTETLAELAEQNARLVSAVEVLRLRTRVLVWGGAAVLVWLAVLTWWA